MNANTDAATSYDYDYLVVGSGFGGSVSACRLTEKGYSVAVVEMGKRWRAEAPASSNTSPTSRSRSASKGDGSTARCGNPASS